MAPDIQTPIESSHALGGSKGPLHVIRVCRKHNGDFTHRLHQMLVSLGRDVAGP